MYPRVKRASIAAVGEAVQSVHGLFYSEAAGAGVLEELFIPSLGNWPNGRVGG